MNEQLPNETQGTITITRNNYEENITLITSFLNRLFLTSF